MSDNKFVPTRQPRPSYLIQQGGSASSSSAGPSTSRLAAPSAAGASRFGFRAPSAGAPPSSSSAAPAGGVTATPLGKRTVSNTSLPDHANGVGSAPPSSAKRPLTSSSTPLRSSRPPSPSSTQQLSAIKSQYESRLLLSQQSYDGLEDAYRKLATEVERLKSERRELAEEWARVKEERAAEQREWQQEREKLRSQVNQERAARSEAEEELQGAAEDAARQRQDSQAELNELRVRLGRAEAEKAELQERTQMDEDRRRRDAERLSREMSTNQELEAKVAKLESKVASSSASPSKDAAVERELHRILAHSRQLEGQVATLNATTTSLRKQAEGTAVLKEENLLLRNKVDSLTTLQSRLVELEEHQERRQAEEKAWDEFLAQPNAFSSKLEAEAAMSAGDVDADLPTLPLAPQPMQRASLPAYLCNLRGLVSGLLTRSQILSSKVASVRQRQESLESELEGKEEEVRQCKRQETEASDKVLELQRVKAQWEEENRRYRGLLKSYEEQEKRDGEASKSEAAAASIKRDEDQEMEDAQATPAASAAHLERISLLESELEHKRSEISSLAQQHEEATHQLKSSHLAAQQEVESLSSDLLVLQRENERLDTALGKAEERIGLGHFDQEKYRCLVLKQNPVDVDRDLRTKTMNRIKGENEELVKRVEDLSRQLAEAGSSAAATAPVDGNGDAAAAAGLVPAATVSNLRTEIASLTSQLALKDKTLLRLKQVYTSKASEFRSAIQSLFGFKVRFLENGAVRLNSTFARSTSRATSLVFASEEGGVGRMKLTGEAAKDLSLANVPHLREYWLAEGGMRQSVPCFLAALQLELYESTTQAVRGAWAVPDADEEEE